MLAGVGDDAAVIKAGGKGDLLATADMLAERVHFDLSFTAFRDLGYKALAVNLSDIAAMGGRPDNYLVSIALPPHFNMEDMEEIYRGMDEAGRPHRVCLVGGDTVASPGPLVISITLLGRAARGKAVLRSGALPGDGLYVTGTLGDSAAGLELLKAGRRPGGGGAGAEYLIRRHLRPEARVKAGRLLGGKGLASAMIDISDGIASDIRHITERSGCGAEINLDALPLSDELLSFAGRKNAVKYALEGGEDYELLLAAHPGSEDALGVAGKAAGVAFTKVGTITWGEGVFAVDSKGTRKALKSRGYEHFRK